VAIEMFFIKFDRRRNFFLIFQGYHREGSINLSSQKLKGIKNFYPFQSLEDHPHYGLKIFITFPEVILQIIIL